MTPRDKYQNDPRYKMLVDTMVNQIVQCKYTPSEIAEAAILACIIYEEMQNPETTIFRYTAVLDFLYGK